MIDFSGKTYQAILSDMLSRVPNIYDKRDTSPIQTALGPAGYQIEGIYLVLAHMQNAAYVGTATGEDLDAIAPIGGITRFDATPAVRLGVFNVPIYLGARFSTVDGANSIDFVATSATDDPLKWWLTAETPGTIGNQYTGIILPISTIPGLQSAQLTDIIVDGSDQETDEAFRERLISTLTDRPFAGNIAAYKKELLELASVTASDGSSVAVKIGGVQVYPIWNGGGTVKCSVVGADFLPVSSDLLPLIQDAVDPVSGSGRGLGIAPIGAQVTVTTATPVTVNVAATINHTAGTTLASLQPLIEASINSYLNEVRAAWGTAEATDATTYISKVYTARILTSMFSVSGVTNVASITINGLSSDLNLTENSTVQEIPVLGTVTLREG